jgi:hypothetical protein
VYHISVGTRHKETCWKLLKQHRIGGKGQGSAVEGGYIDLSTVHAQLQYQDKNATE